MVWERAKTAVEAQSRRFLLNPFQSSPIPFFPLGKREEKAKENGFEEVVGSTSARIETPPRVARIGQSLWLTGYFDTSSPRRLSPL